VDGNADHHLVADLFAHLRRGHVLLPDVHALGTAGDSDVHIVVDEQRHAVALAQRRDLLRLFKEILVAELLFAHLHTGRAALERAFDLLV
jgi:hypothetical protein